MALFWRIWAAVVLVNLVVLSVFVGLATLRYASINSALVGERLTVLANRTAAPFAAAAGIGLSLREVRNAPAVLERARQTDERILAIHVFDAEWRVVHSTSAITPESLPAAAIAAHRAAAGRPWHRETDQGFLSGIAIPRGNGTPAGGVVVVYPRQGSITQVWAMSAELAVAGMVVLLLSSGFGGILLRVGLGRQITFYCMIERSVAAFECRSWRRGPEPPAATRFEPVASDADELGQLLASAEQRYLEAGRHLADVRREAPDRAP